MRRVAVVVVLVGLVLVAVGLRPAGGRDARPASGLSSVRAPAGAGVGVPVPPVVWPTVGPDVCWEA